jgi:hypothetical protein
MTVPSSPPTKEAARWWWVPPLIIIGMFAVGLLIFGLTTVDKRAEGTAPPPPTPTYVEIGLSVSQVELPDGRTVVCVSSSAPVGKQTNKGRFTSALSCDWDRAVVVR